MKKQIPTILIASLSAVLISVVSLVLVCALTVSIIALPFVAVASPFIFFGIVPIIETNHFLRQELDCEAENYPAFFVNGTVYTEKDKYKVYNIVKDQNEDYSLSEVLYLSNDCIYIVVDTLEDEDGYKTKAWMVASVDRETLDYSELLRINGCADWYSFTQEGKPYDQRNGYYHNGCIVLNNGETVYEYNIFDDTVKQYTPNEYEFPAYTAAGEEIDDETISITVDGISKTYTLSDIASDSPAVSEIYELKDKKTIDGTPRINDFFGTISWVNENIYAVCHIQAFSGDLFAVILKYDHQNDTWLYCTGYHMGGATTVYLITCDD